jgi:polysaccharide pyruvyl transferase WcaK-like protein
MLSRLTEIIAAATGESPVVFTGPRGDVENLRSYAIRSYWHWLPRLEWGSRTLGIANWFRCWPSRVRYIRALSEVQTMILGGGSLLHVEKNWLPSFLDQLGYAKARGKQVVLFGIGVVGEPTGRRQREQLGQLLQLVDLTVFRDRISYDIAVESVGEDANVLLASDPLYPLALDQNVLVTSYSTAVSRPAVGLAPRGSLYWRGTNEQLIDTFSDLSQMLLDAGHRVSLLSFGDRWDMSICEAIAGRIDDTDRVSVPVIPRQSGALRELLAGLSCVVAMPLHAMLLSSIFGTPVVPLSYQSKCIAFCTEVGIRPLAHDLTLHTLPPAAELLTLFEMAQHYYHENATLIAEAIQQQKAKAFEAEGLLAATLRRRRG